MPHAPIHITKYNGKYRIYAQNKKDQACWLCWYKPNSMMIQETEGYSWYHELPSGITAKFYSVTVFEFNSEEEAERQVEKYLETINIKPLKTFTFE